jgi:glycosyltransferase involved in cell wall biosynthesis
MTKLSAATFAPSESARSGDLNRRRIAIFEPYIFDTIYGNTRYISTIFKFIDRRQVEPFLISPIEGGFLKEIEAHGGACRVLPAPAALRRYGGAILGAGFAAKLVTLACLAWYSLRLAICFRREGIEIVQCHSSRAILTAGLAAKIAGCRVIWYVKGLLENPLLDRVGFSLANRILFQGEANLKRRYPGLIRKFRNKISILPNGIDLEEIDAAERRARDGVVHDLDLREDHVNIVFVGQVMRAKGLDELIEAMAMIQQDNPDTALYVVGDHCIDEYRAYRREIESAIESSGVKNVNFLGWRKDVHDIVSLMDIFVLPSHAEGVPKSVIEAMALSKPVLATTVGSIPDLVTSEENGILVPPKDVDALASQLGRLIRDPELRQRLGKAAAAHARDNCSIQRNMRGLERLYREFDRDGS